MADYTGMSAFYDLIMTSGYYDYSAVAAELTAHVDAVSQQGRPPRVLELGCGTGLILERLAGRCPGLSLTGVDVTASMLDRASDRLDGVTGVNLVLADVRRLALDGVFEVVFSYGGVWYLIPQGESFTLVSHLRDDVDNRIALARVATHMPNGGKLLLGVQAPHVDYRRPVWADLVYEQQIDALDDGFRKRYRLWSGAHVVMDQVLEYRIYAPDEARDLLESAGFTVVVEPGPAPLFVELVRR